jgi:large subunit ribosomal protein L13
MTKIHTINAEGKVLGRVASTAAKILMGKTTPDYVANKVADVSVVIENVAKTKMTDKRKEETIHERYSGQPGGFRTHTNAEIINKKGWKKLYELAVYGMLPANKLRPLIMKRLKIKE